MESIFNKPLSKVGTNRYVPPCCGMGRKSEVFRSGDRKQIWSGLFFLLLGAGTLWQLPPDIGTAATVGPGFFPMLLGICLILLGGASTVAGCRSRTAVRAEPIPVRLGPAAAKRIRTG